MGKSLVTLGFGYLISSQLLGYKAAQRSLIYFASFFTFFFFVGILVAIAFIYIKPFWLQHVSLGIGIITAVLIGIHIIRWNWRKRQAGVLLLKVGRLSNQKFILYICCPLLVLSLIYLLINQLPTFSFSESDLATLLLFGSSTISSLLFALNSLEFRDNALCIGLEVFKWERLTSYTWEGKKGNILTIQVKPHFPLFPGFISLPIPSIYKNEVERIMVQYLSGRT